MAAATFSPEVLKELLKRLPEVQKRQRRVKRLRGDEERYNEMRDRERELGSVTPSVDGGLYEIQGRYIPNYQGSVEKILGAGLGYLSGREAEKEEEEYNALRNQAVLEGTEQLGVEGGPSDASLRAYLGMMGEDVKDIVGKPKHYSKTLVDGKTLEYLTQYSDGTVEPTGRYHDPKKALVTEEGLPISVVNLEGPESGKGSDVRFGTTPAPLGTPPAGAPPAGAPPAVPGAEAAVNGALGMPNQAADAATAAGMDMVKVGPVSVDMTGMPPEAKEEVNKTLNSLMAAGVDPATLDKVAQTFAVKADAMRTGTLQPGQQMGQITEVSNEPGIAEPPAGPVPQPAPVPGAPAPAPAAAGPAPSPGYSHVMPTAAEKASAIESAKIQAQNQAAVPTAIAGAIGEGAKADAKAAADARAMLPSAEQFEVELDRSITNLRGHEGLPDVIGDGLLAGVSLLSDVPILEHLNPITKFMMRGTPAMDALAQFDQLRGQVFMPAFKTLKGGGQITEKEGMKAEQAMARMSQAQSMPAFEQAMDDFMLAYREGLQKMRDTAAGKYAMLPGTVPGGPGMAAPAPAPAPASGGWQVVQEGP